MTTPAPLDIGALLRLALARSGHTAAHLATLTGMTPGNVSKALRSPNTRAPTARRILLALGASVTLGEPAPCPATTTT